MPYYHNENKNLSGGNGRHSFSPENDLKIAKTAIKPPKGTENKGKSKESHYCERLCGKL